MKLEEVSVFQELKNYHATMLEEIQIFEKMLPKLQGGIRVTACGDPYVLWWRPAHSEYTQSSNFSFILESEHAGNSAIFLSEATLPVLVSLLESDALGQLVRELEKKSEGLVQRLRQASAVEPVKQPE